MYSTSSSRALKGLPIHLRVNRECEESLLSVFASLRSDSPFLLHLCS